jgi:hypothetical protein
MIVNPRHAGPVADSPRCAARIRIKPRTRRRTLRGAIQRPFLLPVIFAAVLTVVLCPSLCSPQAGGGAPRRVLDNNAIVQGIDAAVHARDKAIAGYTVNDRYDIFLGQGSNPEAEKVVTVVFNRSSGDTITPTAESGNSLLISMIIDQVLSAELEDSAPDYRAGFLIDSDNYEMTPEPTRVQMKGRECIVVDLQAKRSSPSLFNGKAWVDARNFDFVHLEGAPSQAPNVLVGDITFMLDYGTVDGFNMPVHSESHATSPLLGATVLTIDSTGYQIRH